MERKVVERGLRRVIYMPTLRGLPGSDFTLFRDTRFDFEAMDKTCGKLGIEFWIKLHPVQRFAREDLEAIRRCENFQPYTESTDIYEAIGRFDILVTDFSGIYFDYLISGRPIVMAPLDMGNYLANDRSLYYPYEELCPDSPCDTWEQVFDRIAGLLESGVAPEGRYFELQKRFHAHLDDESSARAYTAIERMLADGRV
jgi:CDP-glycerol glycerophosphotransferase (TagB/SpsB family)